jgi:hypothetical protein
MFLIFISAYSAIWSLPDINLRFRTVVMILYYKKFWEELMAYFPLKQHEPHRKRRLKLFFVAAGTFLLSHCLAKKIGYTDRPTDSSLI